MNTTGSYIKGYFEKFLVDSGIEGMSYLWVSLDDFLENESKDSAFAVYTSFFDCFRINLEDHSFVDLLDALHSYEEQSSVLLDKQRDHLIHSVNVFALGLSIYAENKQVRNYFADVSVKGGFYNGALVSPGEEFLYRWGLAALLHDVGYPIEIIHNQFRKFVSFISVADDNSKADPFLDYINFSALDSISEVMYKSVFTKKFMDALSKDIKLDPLKPTHLIAYNFHATLGVPFDAVSDAVTSFLNAMQKSGFVDHGYYSAIILLKWYGYLIQKSGLPADILYHPVLDSASAIFLHNYYRNGLMKPPFSLGALSMMNHPLGYLLILCDELQEWNRTAYGIKDKQRILAETSDIEINDDMIKVHFVTSKGLMSETFGKDKGDFLHTMLQIHDVFPNGIELTQTTNSELYLQSIMEKDHLIARPLLSNLEKMAKIIHANYVKKREADGKEVEYPTWDDLPDTLKYSNIRQARSVYTKLTMLGFEVSAEPLEGFNEVMGFSPEQVEMLAREEHDEWVAERIRNGWTHGERDAEKKTNPYLIPYAALPENIKDYDRDAVLNIFPILCQLGLRVYAKL
jgi:hypothetical protein